MPTGRSVGWATQLYTCAHRNAIALENSAGSRGVLDHTVGELYPVLREVPDEV